MSWPTADCPASAIQLQNVCLSHGKRTVLHNVDLRVEAGEMFALLGNNGAGKTTLLSILSTLCAPTAGQARVFGCDVVRQAATVRRSIGVVFQDAALEQRLSAIDNLQLMARFYGLDGRAARMRAIELLDSLGLSELAGQPVHTLSGGQRRKLELARALVAKPSLLLLDEATLGLDVHSRHAFWAEVRTMVQRGCTVFFTTHYMEEAESADRVALLDSGRIVAVDSPQHMRNSGGILLKTENDPAAFNWLRQHGYAASMQPAGLLVCGADRASLLPQLLREMPFAVQRVELPDPGLETILLQKGERTTTRSNSGMEPAWLQQAKPA